MVNRVWISPEGRVTIQWLNPVMLDLLGRLSPRRARGPSGPSCQPERRAAPCPSGDPSE